MSSEFVNILRDARTKTFENADRITLERVLRDYNPQMVRNDGVVDVNEFLTRQVLALMNQGETTRFGNVTQPFHYGVLENAGLTILPAPKNYATNAIIVDTRDSLIIQLNQPSVTLARFASSPTFGNSVNATRERMVELRWSDYPVNGIPLKDINDVRTLVGSLHCDHFANHYAYDQQVDYRFGRHFAEYFGMDIDVTAFDLDLMFSKLDSLDRDHRQIFGLPLNHATLKQLKAQDVARKLSRELAQNDGVFNGVNVLGEHGDEFVFNALDRARMTEKMTKVLFKIVA
jgi:hypothetical protein